MTDIEHVQADNLENELSNIPEKLRGKSQADLVQMYLEAESKSSRVANELGEARRLVTQLLEVQPKQVETKQEPVREITADELLSDPNKTLKEAINTHPDVVEARKRTEELERQVKLKDFEKEYPDYKTDLADPKFAEWVQKNEGRKRLIFMANQYDTDAARALWQMWGEYKELSSAAEARAAAKAEAESQERAGTLEGASGADSSSEVVLNRAELRELHRKALLGDKAALAKWNDPKFRKMRINAYAEGRAE